ncbi:hypothetical protein QTG54_008880 [Skeletonema marinoi]|uniref:PDZ domain-containing protein n=2 Tax=Skeletonema marinoi TaxID=267567 RepID=A0AAD8Y848_9STRA|nr:hypothetical protein QTG54_008880 [Skeletonema marinoi]
MFNFLDSFCGVEVKEEPTSPAAVSVPEKEVVVPATHEADSKIQEHDVKNAAATKITLKPVDPMDATNYLTAHLTRPMGILFEENYDVQHGGAFLAEINEGGSAAADGSICRGDQLIAIGEKRVSGMDFEEVIKIIEGSDINIKLTVFRGPAESLYGPSGASLEWLDEFVAERGEEAALVEEEDLLDDVAAAAADAVGETVKTELFNAVAAAVRDAVGEIDNAGETPVDAEAHVEEESTAEVVEELVVAENEIEADKGTDSEADQEKAADTATVREELVVVENKVDVVDEKVECENDLEKETDVAEAEAEEAVVVDNEVVADEEVGCEVDVEKDAVSATSLIEIEVELGEDEFEADLEKVGDAAADVEAEEALEAAENEGNADELEADQEKEGDTADETLVVVENEVEADVEASSEADVEKEVEKSDEVLVVVENEVDVVDEEVECEADLEKESDTADEALAIVENEIEADEEVSPEIALETDAPTINGAVNEDLLDNHYANTASESVATALASVVEKEISNNAEDSFVDLLEVE